MTRALYLLGAPAVGKSTAMRKLLLDYSAQQPVRLHGRLLGIELRDARQQTGIYLGKINTVRPGVDTLHDPQRDALHWAVQDHPEYKIILAEGSALATASFLTALHRTADLSIIYLIAPQMILKHRRELRHPAQNGSWLTGETVRAAHTVARCRAAGCHIVTISTDQPLDHTVSMIKGVRDHHDPEAYELPSRQLYDMTGAL